MTRPEDRSAPRDGRLAEPLAAYRTGEDTSEDTAMSLAKAELGAARWDHQTMVCAWREAGPDEIEAELFG